MQTLYCSSPKFLYSLYLLIIVESRRHQQQADFARKCAADYDAEEEQVDAAFDDSDRSFEALRCNYSAVSGNGHKYIPRIRSHLSVKHKHNIALYIILYYTITNIIILEVN